MANPFAYFMLWGWPIITVILFRLLPVPKAAAAALIAGYLLLPTQPSINFPMLPPYERGLAAALPVLVMAYVMTRPQPPHRPVSPTAPPPAHVLDGWLPRAPLLKACLVVLVITPFLTALTNTGSVQIGGAIRPGLTLYDGASNVLGAAMNLIPFLVARKLFAHPDEHRMLLGMLCLAGLAYSLPALYEVRMSPQLNNMFYGFFPHNWGQHMRGGGYRPLVFLEHGLRLGIFMAVAVLAASGLFRSREAGNRAPVLLAALWLFGTLILCKSVGALIIASLLAPVILLAGARMQILLAAFLAGTVLFYPMMRSSGLVPMETLRSTLSVVVSSGRMASLEFRFRNEDALLERANEQPLFGWGGWGRNMLYDEEGRTTSVTDGTWVIVFGKDGWVGYLATFGLLTLPLLLLAVRRREDLTLASSALGLALAANLVDLVPNSGLTPITWMMAGAITGRLELGRVADEDPSEVKTQAPVQASPYRRTFPGSHDGTAPATLRRRATQARGDRRTGAHRT